MTRHAYVFNFHTRFIILIIEAIKYQTYWCISMCMYRATAVVDVFEFRNKINVFRKNHNFRFQVREIAVFEKKTPPTVYLYQVSHFHLNNIICCCYSCLCDVKDLLFVFIFFCFVFLYFPLFQLLFKQRSVSVAFLEVFFCRIV